MKYWFFKLENNSLNNKTINFETRTKFKGKIGDGIVFLSIQSGDLSFTYYGIIDSLEFEKIDEKLYINKVFLKIYEIYEEDNLLENYTYSIKRITNFERPEVNFKVQLGTLQKVEFDGIINGEFFYARTAFGKYVNALPGDHQLAFVKYFIEIAPEIYFSTTKNFDKALEVLENYIQDRITIPARFLNQGFKILSNYVNDSELNDIGVSTPDKPIDRLKPQIDIIEKHLDEVRNKEERVENSRDFRNSEVQDLYKKRFSKTDWPFNFSI